MLFINKLFNSIACLLSFTNLQLVIPGRTWILLYLGRTVYEHLWACLAVYKEFQTKPVPEKKRKHKVDADEIIKKHSKKGRNDHDEHTEQTTTDISKKSDRKNYAT